MLLITVQSEFFLVGIFISYPVTSKIFEVVNNLQRNNWILTVSRRLKRQSHEKVVKIRPWDVILGANQESLPVLVFKFSWLAL
jgi:hypothetical protein